MYRAVFTSAEESVQSMFASAICRKVKSHECRSDSRLSLSQKTLRLRLRGYGYRAVGHCDPDIRLKMLPLEGRSGNDTSGEWCASVFSEAAGRELRGVAAVGNRSID